MHACIDDDWIFDLYSELIITVEEHAPLLRKDNEMEIWEEHEMKIICRRMSTKIWVETQTTLK